MSEMPAAEAPRRAAGRPRQGEVLVRRARLIACATELFLKSGYHGTSLAQVAAHARVAVRTIYQQFGDKRGLLQAVLQAGPGHPAATDAAPPDANNITAALHGFAAEYLDQLGSPQALAWQRLRLEAANAGARAASAGLQARLAAFFACGTVRTRLATHLSHDFLAAFFLACLGTEHTPRPSIAVLTSLFLRAVQREPAAQERPFPL